MKTLFQFAVNAPLGVTNLALIDGNRCRANPLPAMLQEPQITL
jgi:hypothetical protein